MKQFVCVYAPNLIHMNHIRTLFIFLSYYYYDCNVWTSWNSVIFTIRRHFRQKTPYFVKVHITVLVVINICLYRLLTLNHVISYHRERNSSQCLYSVITKIWNVSKCRFLFVFTAIITSLTFRHHMYITILSKYYILYYKGISFAYQ